MLDEIILSQTWLAHRAKVWILNIPIPQLIRSLVDAAMQKILSWLHHNLPDPSMTHNRLLEEHHEGTGEWFLHSEMFKRWKETPGGMLWIRGIRMFLVMLSIGLGAHWWPWCGLQPATGRACFGEGASNLMFTNGLFNVCYIVRRLSSVLKKTTTSTRFQSYTGTSTSEIRPPNPAKTSSAPSCTNSFTTSPTSLRKFGNCIPVMLLVVLRQKK